MQFRIDGDKRLWTKNASSVASRDVSASHSPYLRQNSIERPASIKRPLAYTMEAAA